MAESIRQLWAKKKRTVGPTSTSVVDSLPLASFNRIEYFVNILFTTKAKSFKFSVTNDESGLNDQLYARNGDPINIEINANVNASSCEIEIVNNETEPIVVTLTRSKL